MRSSVTNEFTIGESLAWRKEFCDYPASEWTLVYYFRGAGKGFDVEGIADGDDFNLSVSGDVTAECSAGQYYYQAFVAKDSENFKVDEGAVKVLVGFGSIDVGDTLDNRSEVKKILDAIDARLKGDVTKGVMEYAIGDRQLKTYSVRELSEVRKNYAKLYAQELRAAKRKKGGSFLKTHKVGFNRPS